MIDLKKEREGLFVEFKECSNKLSNSVFETYSSFSNTSGGTIYLGIKENKDADNEIIGVNNPEKIKIDFFNTINNKQKVSNNNISEDDFKIIEIDDKYIIEITVKECKRDQKPIYLNNNLFDSYKRNYEGDFKCSNNEILSMLEDGKTESFDSKLNTKKYNFDDINIDTLHLYREILNENNPENIFIQLSDYDFVIRSGFGRIENDKLILTNAAVLLFTNQNLIKSIFPYYFIDYQEKQNDNESWFYRLTSDDLNIVGNLFNIYSLIVKRILKEVPNPLVINGISDSSTKLMAYIIREALANAITNCDYFLELGIKISKTFLNITFQNVGRLKVGLKQALNGGNSNPRNPSIMTAFRNVRLCDRGGTGIPRIFSSCNQLSLIEPRLFENGENNTTTLVINIQKNTISNDNLVQKEIINCLSNATSGKSIKELILETGFSKTIISTEINKLINEGKVKTNNKKTKGKMFFLSIL